MSDTERVNGPKPRNPVVARAVGRLVAQARHRAGITQAVLAERADLHPTTIARIETGATGPGMASLFILARALNVDPGDLLPTRGQLDGIGGLLAVSTRTEES